jgi:hypothetical protein
VSNQQSQDKGSVIISDWAGRVSNSDARSLPPGAAQIQANLQCIVPGILSCRGGMLPTAFSNEQSDSAYSIIFMYSAHRAEGDYIVYQTSDGAIRAGRNPT